MNENETKKGDSLGTKLILLRGELTRNQVAEATGIDQSTIARIESDETDNPGWYTVAKLAKYY